jgi:hypothetical protein
MESAFKGFDSFSSLLGLRRKVLCNGFTRHFQTAGPEPAWYSSER